MPTRLNPYLGFKGNAREAMDFYHSVFGGQLDVQTFKDMNASQDSSQDDLIMHAMLVTDNELTLMGSDVPDGMEFTPGTNISISLSGDEEDELRGYYDKLSEGGTIVMPLQKAMWGDTFGMLTDRFGIGWLVNIAGEASSEASTG